MIGSNIQYLRNKKRMSLTELADRAGVAKSYLSSIERDLQSNPSIQFLQKLAPVLGVQIEDLIPGHDTDMRAEKHTALDPEWKEIILELDELGVTKESVRRVIRQMRTSRPEPRFPHQSYG